MAPSLWANFPLLQVVHFVALPKLVLPALQFLRESWQPAIKKVVQTSLREADPLGALAMVPRLPEDSALISLPFAGAALRALGVNNDEVDELIETRRREAARLAQQQREQLLRLRLDHRPAAVAPRLSTRTARAVSIHTCGHLPRRPCRHHLHCRLSRPCLRFRCSSRLDPLQH